MEKGEVFISEKDGVTFIRAKGNASFVCAPPLRELAKKLASEPFGGLKIDLEECTWMDSTFMGMLAMLGLNKVFAFLAGTFGGAGDTAAASNAATAESNARNVLDAHQTLMDIDEGNVQKFEKVVEFVKKDIDRMEQKKD